MGKIGRGGRSARPDGYFGCPEIKNKKNWPSARSCYGSKSGQLIMKRTLYSTATDRATTDVSINLRQFTITANGHDTRGGSGKAKLKFRPGVSDRKEKTGTIEMTAEIVSEMNNRVQACYIYNIFGQKNHCNVQNVLLFLTPSVFYQFL